MFQDLAPSPSSILVLPSHQQHPEAGYGVIYRKFGEFLHLEAAACPRTLYWIYYSLNLLNKHIFLWRCDPTRVMASSLLMFLDHTQRRTTVGRTPLDEWSARRTDLYLTTHDPHNSRTSMPPVGFEPTISAGERPQTYALDRAATGIGRITLLRVYNVVLLR